MNKNIKVSVITVVYNGEKFLEQTIKSVLQQTYKNIEYIIIDGESIDGTINIIRKYEKQLSLWISEPDKGLYDAMNKGIKLATGELIGIINSDDWYEPFAVETMVDAFCKLPEKTIFHADRFDIDINNNKKLRKFNSSQFKFKYYGMTYNHPSFFVSKSEYDMHLYNADLNIFSDYQFVLETFLQNKNQFFYIDKAIVNYRLDGLSSQLSLFETLKEGFIARRNAGLSLSGNLFHLIFLPLVAFFKPVYRYGLKTFILKDQN